MTTLAIGMLFLAVFAIAFAIYTFGTNVFDFRDVSKLGDSEAFLEDVDLAAGKYAPVIQRRHDQPPQMIDDETALIENQSAVRLKINHLLSFVPGEGGFGEAVYLFKDRQLVKSANPKAFSIFEMGTLEQSGRPVTSKVYTGFRDDYLAEARRMAGRRDIYVYQTNEPDPDAFEYQFTVRFPSIATNDEAFDASAAGATLYERVLEALQHNRTDFRIDYPSAFGGSVAPLLLCDSSFNDCPYLYGSDGSVLKLEGWTAYRYQLNFSATPQFYADALQWDFNKHQDEALCVNTPVLSAIDDVLAASGVSVPRARISTANYEDQVSVTTPKQKQYSLRYSELMPGPENEG